MGRRQVFSIISVITLLASIGVFVRGQYVAWQAAQLELASQHRESPTIDIAMKRDGWVLRDSGLDLEAAAKRNAADHHRTLAVILAVAGVFAGYWAWAKCRPPLRCESSTA